MDKKQLEAMARVLHREGDFSQRTKDTLVSIWHDSVREAFDRAPSPSDIRYGSDPAADALAMREAVSNIGASVRLMLERCEEFLVTLDGFKAALDAAIDQ